MTGLLITFALLAAGCGGAGGTATGGDNPYRQFQLKDLQKVTLTANSKEFKVWVMDSEEKRQEGLMFVGDKDIKATEGMLFAFKYSQPLSFWMKNTYIDLDIAYIDKNKKVLNVLTMKAFDVTTDYASAGDAMYALELKAGVCKKNGIKAGMKVTFPDTVVGKS
jgi:uncharacterized membrane protein (UPF0127 family)